MIGEYKDVQLHDINQDKMTCLLQNKSNTSLRDIAPNCRLQGQYKYNKQTYCETDTQTRKRKQGAL